MIPLLLILAQAPAYPAELPPRLDPWRVAEAAMRVAWDEPRDTSGQIDVLFAWSASAWPGDTQARAIAQQVADQWNTAAVNEGLPTSMRVCGVMTTTYTDSGNPLSWMAGTGRPELWAELTRLGCDLAHLATRDNACGQGFVGTSAAMPWSQSHVDCLVGNLSGIHELGHNVGLHHEPPSACGQPVCSGYNYGHAWPVTGPFQRDPMTYPAAGGNRVLWWSSPLHVLHGGPIGIAGQRDNARVIRERAAIVAGFRAATGGIPVPRPATFVRFTED